MVGSRLCIRILCIHDNDELKTESVFLKHFTYSECFQNNLCSHRSTETALHYLCQTSSWRCSARLHYVKI